MKSTQSIWNHFSETKNYPQLRDNISVDAAIIGGGITGVSLSKILGERGIENVVLESRKVGISTTSHSTGNLYSTIDSNLSSLESKYNPDTVKEVINSRAEALEQISRWVETHEIECDFKRVPMYLYSSDEENSQKIIKELKTGRNAGMNISDPENEELPYPTAQSLKISGQAQFNPMQYVQGLAGNLHPENSTIFENSHVQSVEKNNGKYHLRTSGYTITANFVIHATHTPKGIKFVQTLLGPYREYGIACRANGFELPDGIFWGYHGEGKKFSTRICSRGDEGYLIVVGEPHKVGHQDNNEHHLGELRKFAARYSQSGEPEFLWGGQHYRPADLLPYIGPHQKNSGEYIATGFATDGLVYGTLAAQIIADSISGHKNRWSELYSATRKQPVKSAPKFMKENTDVAKHYVKEIVNFPPEEFRDLQKGEGKIITHEGEKLAISRDKNGELCVISAICTHMGCTVHWNYSENSWDCPCHGSRFDSSGNVLEGPAFEGLQSKPSAKKSLS